MAYRYTDVDTRTVYRRSGGIGGQQGKTVKFWANAAGTTPIDVGLYSEGTPNTPGTSTGTNTLEVQADQMWPAMWDRTGTNPYMWIQVGTASAPGDLYKVFADADQRINALAADLADAESTAAAATASALLGARTFARSAQGALTISWDDGFLEIYNNLWPRLRDTHTTQCHTIALTPGLLNNVNNLYMSTAQVQEVANSRHEIASHSQNHSDIDSQSVGTRITEYDISKTNLEAMIGRPVTTFVYPFGDNGRNVTTDRELWGRYDRIVNAGQPVGIAQNLLTERFGLFLIPRCPPWTSASHQDMLNAVRLAAAQPVVMNLYSHRPGFDMTLAELDELLTLADTLGVPVINLRDAYPAGGLLSNPGAEAGTTSWATVATGSGGAFQSTTDAPASGFPGTKSFHISNPGDAQFLYAYQYVPTTEGLAYTFSAMARTALTSGAGYVRLRIQPVDYRGANSGTVAQSSDITATSWTQVTLAATMPAGTKGARVDMIVLNKTGEAWFDHLHFGLTRDGVFG